MNALSTDTAGICGLFCGTCAFFGTECDGCLSDRVAPFCADCRHGFRTCSAAHGITRCHECGEFPCARLEEFSKIHIEHGVCHHTHVIDDLRFMRERGVEAWVEKQTQEHTCPKCGKLIIWYAQKCPDCFPEND